MDSIGAEWRDVKGFSGYQVSSDGRIRSVTRVVRSGKGLQPREIAGREMRQSRHSGGYLVVGIGGKKYVHRLVAAAFFGDSDGRDVNHKNGIKTDNRVENLEYATRVESVRHAIDTGLQDNGGERNGMSRYTERQIRDVHDRYSRGETLERACAATGVGMGIAEAVVRGERWKCLGLPRVRKIRRAPA